MKDWAIMVLLMTNTSHNQAQNMLLTQNENCWVLVNDDVMGGRSKSAIDFLDNVLSFSGQLSFENNGGFASLRCQLEEPIVKGDKVSISVNGDGRLYQLRLKNNFGPDGVAYKVEFIATQNQWQTFTFDVKEFKATFRGRDILNAPQLVLSDVRQVSFLIADKQPRIFKLNINRISFM